MKLYEVFTKKDRSRAYPCSYVHLHIYTIYVNVYHQFCLKRTRVHFAGLPVASNVHLGSFKASFAFCSRQRKELEAQPSALRLTVVDSNATMVAVAFFSRSY